MTLKRPLDIFQAQRKERLMVQTKLTGYFHPKVDFFCLEFQSNYVVFHFILSWRNNGLNNLCTGRCCARSYDAVNQVASECHLKFPHKITSVSMRKYTATLTQVSVSMFCDNCFFFHMAKYKMFGYLSTCTCLSSKKVLYYFSVQKFWIRWYKN